MGFLPKNPFTNKPATAQGAQPPTTTPVEITTTPYDDSEPLNAAILKQPTVRPKEPDFTPKTRPVRDANGKFVSKKKPVEPPIAPAPTTATLPPATAEEEQAETHQETSTEPDRSRQDPQTVTFYGFQVRKFHDGGWYFSLLDILTLARIILPPEYLHTIKQKPEAETILKDSIKVFTYAKDPETLERVEAISYEGFMKLLPIMRSQQTIFPGPFPEWLQNMANTPPETN